MNAKEELIYDLIFSERIIYTIDISKYVEDIYSYEDFVSDIKKVLKKSKVGIVKSSVLVDSKTVIWELKLKK